tara:strand:+ start:606 stop:1040 length:435 start_codon:yes stop_codon:yes gene_type:complete
MSAVSLANVRSAISSNIDAVSGFTLLKLPPAYFGRSQNTIAHLGFTVGIDSTNESTERQRGISNQFYLISSVTVKFLYRLRPLDLYPTDYDNCLDKEELVIKAVLGDYTGSIKIRPRYISSQREISNSMEYMITTINFQVQHSI